ncbi:CHAT domain-containing protein, partial [Nostoc sp.]
RYPQLTQKFRQLRDLSNQITHLTFAVPETDRLATYQDNLRQLQSRHNNLQKQLAAQVPEIQLSQQTFDRQAIVAALPPNSILVEFVRFDAFDFQAISANGETQWHSARYLAFILTAGKLDTVQMIDLGTADTIDRLIIAFRLEASDYTHPTLAWGKGSQAPKLHIKSYNSTDAMQLSQALFDPIRDLVKDCRHLIIAPDGNLNLVPFQILPIDATGSRLLMDEYTISYLSVGREILRSKVQLPTGFISTPLIIADPDFDLTADAVSGDWGLGIGNWEKNSMSDVRSPMSSSYLSVSDELTQT